MDIKKLSPEVKQIWRVAKVVQSVMGFTMGLYIFICGPLYYEALTKVTTPQSAIFFTTLIYGIYMALIAFLEVPTGAIGDTIGRKWTVVWSFVCYMLYYISLSFIPVVSSLWLILTLAFVGRIIMSFAYTFFSGTFTAWCVDSLRETAPEIGYEHLLSKAYTYNNIAMMLGGVLSVLFYLWHVAHVGFLIAAFACLAVISFCLIEIEDVKTLQFLEHKKVSLSLIIKRMGEVIGVGLDVFRRSTVIVALVFVFASYGFVVNIVDYLWPVYVRSKIDVSQQAYYWIGLVIAIQLFSAAGSSGLTFLTRRWHKDNDPKTHNVILRRLFIGTSLLSALPILMLSFLTNLGLDTFLFFSGAILAVEFACGVIVPCYETLINNYIPEKNSQERATILSIGSLLRSMLIMLLAIPSGGMSGSTTTVGWAIPAFILLLAALAGNHVLKRAQQKVPEIEIFESKENLENEISMNE